MISLDHWLAAATKLVLAAGVSLVACVIPLYAQEGQLTQPKIEAKVTFGGANFVDDSKHTMVGGAVRAYVRKRISLETEYLYLHHSDNDQDWLVQPSVAVDFTDPTKRFVAYGLVGAGVLHHKGRYFGNDFATGAPRVFDTSFTGWTASIGGGVKIFLTKRLFVSPEFRVGREPTVRGTISVGYVFGGRRSRT